MISKMHSVLRRNKIEDAPPSIIERLYVKMEWTGLEAKYVRESFCWYACIGHLLGISKGLDSDSFLKLTESYLETPSNCSNNSNTLSQKRFSKLH